MNITLCELLDTHPNEGTIIGIKFTRNDISQYYYNYESDPLVMKLPLGLSLKCSLTIQQIYPNGEVTVLLNCNDFVSQIVMPSMMIDRLKIDSDDQFRLIIGTLQSKVLDHLYKSFKYTSIGPA